MIIHIIIIISSSNGRHSSNSSNSRMRRDQNDEHNSTDKSVDQSSDLVNHPFRCRYRVWPQTFRDFGDSVNRSFPLR